MSATLRLSRRAERDLIEIGDFTAERWSPRQANIYLTGLVDALEQLCENPTRHAIHPDLRGEIRVLRYVSHLALYTLQEERLLVVRILHARSDWQNVLSVD